MAFSFPKGTVSLTCRQRFTRLAHLFKTIFYQYNREFAERIAPLGYGIFKTLEREGYRLHLVADYDGGADYLFVPQEKAGLVTA